MIVCEMVHDKKWTYTEIKEGLKRECFVYPFNFYYEFYTFIMDTLNGRNDFKFYGITKEELDNLSKRLLIRFKENEKKEKEGA